MRIILFLGLLLGTLSVLGQTLSPSAQVSIITSGPYQGELYSAFGHSAIRVYDPTLNIDNAYNYGVFDFDQPNFYLNFARGYLYYELGVYPYPLFEDYYISDNRYVHEQVLDLEHNQRQEVYEFLEWNALPDNKTYRYDYFYDNCATKIRDVFAELFDEKIQFDSTYIETNYTIRELTDLYLGQQPWGDLGIDICLGLPMDKVAAPHEYMFLPDYVESAFNHMTIDGRPLVKETEIVYAALPEDRQVNWFHPWVVFGAFLLFTIVLTINDWRNRKLTKWFDILIFSVVGLVGILLLFLWLATDHQAASSNYNLLWAWPLHAFAFILLIKGRNKSAAYYFFLAALKFGVVLFFWAWLPQQLNVFLVPLIISLLIRSILINRLLRS